MAKITIEDLKKIKEKTSKDTSLPELLRERVKL